ncbi:uncharacterized protein A1O9_01534 [Exophiala aquamarina CBS 119918]|uniref:Uncharacterized protein n=1 Tax=Exophiala aquamarina CBS 119918 TaxID=1182545 RepID=A0A072PUL8_9EURO|nr:uncharacterized protein A1O9_01534 [Exophiala aquamarina CBS 119918]KEF63556.1 hypothetical protein A1O9_01534 [Exophiala aquamarina CBS 119918]
MPNRVLPVPRPVSWPLKSIDNEFGIATLSLGYGRKHSLKPRLQAAAKAGYKWIDLFDECWEAHLNEHGLNGQQPWEPTSENLQLARQLGDLVKSLGLRIICTQPLRKIEGAKDPQERRANLDLPPADPETPPLLPWSRAHRLFPFESGMGAYMPVELVAAAVLATGYQGPISLEIFSSVFDVSRDHVPVESARRGIVALTKLVDAIQRIPAFWNPSREVAIKELVQLYSSNRVSKSSL